MRMPTIDPQEPQLRIPPTTPPHARRSLWWLWVLVLAGLGYGGWHYYQAQAAKKQEAAKALAKIPARPIPILATPARSGDMPLYQRGLGTVTPFNTVVVRSRVDGQLLSIHFSEGQIVKQGQLLAEIDPRTFQVQLQQAEGQLARDTAQLKDAQVNLERNKALWNEKVIAKQQLDTQASLVGQFQGAVEADQGPIENARLQLNFAHITAPITGRIGLRLVDVGNIVKASDTNGLAVIEQIQPISVLFTIPADNLPAVLSKLRAGTKLPVEAWDRDDRNKLASGILQTVDNQIDPTTGTSRLKAVFPNTDGSLFPNQFVNARMLLETRHSVLMVPAQAVQRGPQGAFVYVVQPNSTASVRVVAVGNSYGNDIAIASGLRAGDSVAVDGQDKLQEGSAVESRAAGGPQKRTGQKGRR